MRIRKLRIRNFRSLRDVELDSLGDISVFIGKNSTGKSNLVEALALFFDYFAIAGVPLRGYLNIRGIIGEYKTRLSLS